MPLLLIIHTDVTIDSAKLPIEGEFFQDGQD